MLGRGALDSGKKPNKEQNSEKTLRDLINTPSTSKMMNFFQNSSQDRIETSGEISSPSLLSSEETDDKLRVLVVNLKAEDLKITSELWIQTEGEIQDIMCKFYDNLENSQCLEFEDVGWDRNGHKIVACADDFTLTWLTETISNLTKSAKLERKAIFRKDLESRAILRGWMWVPSPAKPFKTVLKLIAKQNPWLNTTGWSVSYLDEDNSKRKMGYKYYLNMNRECLPALKEKQFVIQYSLAKAVINVINVAGVIHNI